MLEQIVHMRKFPVHVVNLSTLYWSWYILYLLFFRVGLSFLHKSLLERYFRYFHCSPLSFLKGFCGFPGYCCCVIWHIVWIGDASEVIENIPDKVTVGELRSGVTGFATIYATGSHRLVVQAYTENLPHKNKYSNLANERGRIYKFSISVNLLVTGISDFYVSCDKTQI